MCVKCTSYINLFNSQIRSVSLILCDNKQSRGQGSSEIKFSHSHLACKTTNYLVNLRSHRAGNTADHLINLGIVVVKHRFQNPAVMLYNMHSQTVSHTQIYHRFILELVRYSEGFRNLRIQQQPQCRVYYLIDTDCPGLGVLFVGQLKKKRSVLVCWMVQS